MTQHRARAASPAMLAATKQDECVQASYMRPSGASSLSGWGCGDCGSGVLRPTAENIYANMYNEGQSDFYVTCAPRLAPSSPSVVPTACSAYVGGVPSNLRRCAGNLCLCFESCAAWHRCAASCVAALPAQCCPVLRADRSTRPLHSAAARACCTSPLHEPEIAVLGQRCLEASAHHTRARTEQRETCGRASHSAGSPPTPPMTRRSRTRACGRS
jgi:hypothetical protein